MINFKMKLQYKIVVPSSRTFIKLKRGGYDTSSKLLSQYSFML